MPCSRRSVLLGRLSRRRGLTPPPCVCVSSPLVLQTGDTTGERLGCRGGGRQPRRQTSKPEGAAAGDTIDTHEFKFCDGGWAAGATLTVRLRDVGLLALELCLDDTVDVCLCGALRRPPCQPQRMLTTGLWAGCRTGSDGGVSRPCEGPWFHNLVSAVGGRPGDEHSDTGVVALYVYSDKATKRCVARRPHACVPTAVGHGVLRAPVCARLGRGKSGRSKHGLYAIVANSHKARQPVTLGFIDVPSFPERACRRACQPRCDSTQQCPCRARATRSRRQRDPVCSPAGLPRSVPLGDVVH